MKTLNTQVLFALTLLFSAVILLSCGEESSKSKTSHADESLSVKEASTYVMTKEDQERLTPQMVIDDLKSGNDRFVNQESTIRNHSEQVRKTEMGQYPKAIILSCVDSRVPVEDVFDQGIGDIFVGRVAGNFVNIDQLGSMEFATKLAGAKLIVIMGHESCGAVKGAIDKAELGNLTSLLTNIQPAVDAIKEPTTASERTSKNTEFLNAVINKNVQLNLEKTLAMSPVLSQMVEDGELKIVGANYALTTGKVVFFD